jgi:phage tail-like protein
MIVEGFRADTDLVGRRIKATFEFVLEGEETLADIPAVTLYRKTRDFEFGEDEAREPFVIYTSAEFPPAGMEASELPGYETREDSSRTVVSIESAHVRVGSRAIERLRRTTKTSFDSANRPVRRAVEILDSGPAETRLIPGVVYHYELIAGDRPPLRATAAATDTFGLARKMYEMVPPAYRRDDNLARPEWPGAEAVLEASTGAESMGRFVRHGQFRRFVDIFGVASDFLRGKAEGLRTLRDIDGCDGRLLPVMANWIAWDLSFSKSIPEQRHEIRYAARLYQLTGTIPGTMLWVERLSGLRARIKEFARNVFFTNDPGSMTIDTEDEDLLENLRKFEDTAKYTHDSGTTEGHWYALNAVGIFITPDPNLPADRDARSVDARVGQLKRNLHIFLPVNIRGVVIVETPETPVLATGELDLGGGSTEE